MAGSLFERMTLGTVAENIDEDESIRLHIKRMFITRRGAVQTLPEYGLPDLNDLNYSRSDLILECCRAIAAGIEQYEPRLTKVKVEPLKEDNGVFTMSFAVSAMKIGDDGSFTPWHWDLTLDGNNVSDNNQRVSDQR